MNDTPNAAAPSSPPPGYPADLERTWQPAGGPPILIRPLRPDDVEREIHFIRGLSEETLHLRVQYSLREVNEQTVARLLDLDYVNTLAFAALVPADGTPQFVGVSRYARIPDTDRADCAIVVTDEWAGRGIGTELMRSLALAARARGIRQLEAVCLPENQRVAAWARRFGFHLQTEPDSGGMLHVTLDLTQLPIP